MSDPGSAQPAFSLKDATEAAAALVDDGPAMGWGIEAVAVPAFPYSSEGSVTRHRSGRCLSHRYRALQPLSAGPTRKGSESVARTTTDHPNKSLSLLGRHHENRYG